MSTLFPVTTESVEETRAVGAELASRLPPGSVLALYGDLGTGKTHLVKGIAEELGIPADEVRSPTFTILCTYETGRRPLYHFDAYRVQDLDEFVELGYEEYLFGNGITCIEWADRVQGLLPPEAISLTFTHVAPSKRCLSLGVPESAPRSRSNL